jgi:hypothetical protein
MNTYRDNYPHNIEAPQRVYVQYSQDIDFDYSNGQYPLGEAHEGFIWENVYIPVPHQYGDMQLDRHVWMRWRIGERDAWTVPMRFTDSFSNIEATALEEVVGTDKVRFRFQYTLASGEIIYSEWIELTNGIDGRGITSSQIVGTNLILNYSDNTTEDVGRVVGYDGIGFGSVGSDVPGNIIYVNNEGEVVWLSFNEVFDLEITTTPPIEYDVLTGTLSHNNADGYRHIPTGGSSGNLLSTDGAGNYSWVDLDLDNPTTGYIPWTAIDDTAGAGDTNLLFSADHITTLIGGVSAFGIKYSVPLKTDLDLITGLDGELGVVTNDPLYPNRTVFQWSGGAGGNWGAGFFDLDADHNHDTRYYTQTQLQTSGQAQVHWDNLTNVPTLYSSWTAAGDSGTNDIIDGETLNIIGGTGITTTLSGNNLTIDASATDYTAGTGIDITGDAISHDDTSSVGNTANLNGVVVRNMTFDTFGHVQTVESFNLDTRYALLGHVHQSLTVSSSLNFSGAALYNGGAANQIGVNFGGTGGYFGSAATLARSDHDHPPQIAISTFSYPIFDGGNGSITRTTLANGEYLITIRANGYWPDGINVGNLTWLGWIPVAYQPTMDVEAMLLVEGTDGAEYDMGVRIYKASNPDVSGRIYSSAIRSWSGVGAIRRLEMNITYTAAI